MDTRSNPSVYVYERVVLLSPSSCHPSGHDEVSLIVSCVSWLNTPTKQPYRTYTYMTQLVYVDYVRIRELLFVFLCRLCLYCGCLLVGWLVGGPFSLSSFPLRCADPLTISMQTDPPLSSFFRPSPSFIPCLITSPATPRPHRVSTTTTTLRFLSNRTTLPFLLVAYLAFNHTPGRPRSTRFSLVATQMSFFRKSVFDAVRRLPVRGSKWGPLSPKHGSVSYNRGKGRNREGRNTKKGGFVMNKNLMMEIVVPSNLSKDFPLKAYVSHRTEKVES